MKNKIGSVESISLVLIIILNHIILNLPKNIISTTSSSSLLNIIFISILAFIFLIYVTKIFNKFPGYDIIKISNFLGGKVLKYITGILFLLYFLIVSSILLRNFAENLKIIYLQNYSIILIIFLFILSIACCNIFGFKSIIRANVINLPILIFSIIFIFLANIKNFNFENIFPLLGNGVYSTFLSGMSNIYAFSAISIIYFLPPHLNNYKEFKKIAYISIGFSAVLLLLSVSSVLFVFPIVENAEQLMPLYLETRIIEFGRFFQRIDAIFLLIWIISVVSYLSFMTSIVINIFKNLFNIKNSNMLIGSWCLISLAISLIPKDLVDVRFFTNIILRYSTIGLVFVFVFFILLFSNIKLSKEKIKEVKE